MAKKSLSLLLLAILPLAGCAADAEQPEMPQDANHTIAPADPSASPQVQEMTPAQVAVTAGAVMAAQLGFPNSAKITGQDLEDLAQKPTDTLKDIVVLPGNCAGPVEELNFSPVQLGTEAARTDFTNEAQNITGSIETAKLESDADRQALQEHFQTVSKILDSCQSVKINGLDYSETLNFSLPEISSVDSALYYTRDGAYAQDSLVLISATEDYASMVSFVSATDLSDPKFGTVATSILDAAMAQVSE